MKLLLDSVDELTPELLRRMADHEAATGQAADEAVGGVRETSSLLRLPHVFTVTPP